MLPYNPMAMDRMEHFRLPGSPTMRRIPENILPSIESMFGRELGRSSGPVPPVLNSPPYGYPQALESPIRTGPPALTQYLYSTEDPWGTHKQGQQHSPPPLTTSPHYQKPPDYAPHHSPTSSDFPINGRLESANYGYNNRSRSDRILPMSPTTDTTSYQDSFSNINESGTEMYSEPGESELNSGVGDTQSQAGSSVSQMYLRQFLCKTCKQAFKCDSLRR